MANPEHEARLNEGVAKWNKWRKGHSDLFEADLADVIIGGANLAGVNISGAVLRRAELSGANLNGANLSEADLTGANLTGANLSAAIISGADFSEAIITGADFTGAKVGWTTFGSVDLSVAKALDTVIHRGPSHISIDTVYKSKGKIPEVFLRGCGVPEPFIVQMKALVGAMEPIQFYSCFISYSSHDERFAERLNADLRAKNLRCWFAPEDLKIGDRFHERIEESIRVYDKVMIVLSAASVQSRWVEREVTAAREREDHENRTVLFPIRIDDAIMHAPQPWAADIRRSRHIGDFCGWKNHDSYTKAFERLLRDLKADTA